MLISILFAAEIFGHQKPFQTTYYLIIERACGVYDPLNLRIILDDVDVENMTTWKCFIVKIT